MRKSLGLVVGKLGIELGFMQVLFAVVKNTIDIIVHKVRVFIKFSLCFPNLSELKFTNFLSVDRVFIPIIHSTYNKLQLNKLTLLLIAGE